MVLLVAVFKREMLLLSMLTCSLPDSHRLPLVSSAIINVAQDVDEDWILEVYDHDGVGKLGKTTKSYDVMLCAVCVDFDEIN